MYRGGMVPEVALFHSLNIRDETLVMDFIIIFLTHITSIVGRATTCSNASCTSPVHAVYQTLHIVLRQPVPLLHQKPSEISTSTVNIQARLDHSTQLIPHVLDGIQYHIPPCFHAKPPDFPRLIGPRGYVVAVGMCPRSWHGGVGRCRLGAMHLAPWSVCRVQPLAVGSRQCSDFLS